MHAGVRHSRGGHATEFLHAPTNPTPALHRANNRPETKKDLQAEACKSLILCAFFGVADGARTHDNRNHNPGLYQLSYSHHCLTCLFSCFAEQVKNYTKNSAKWQI